MATILQIEQRLSQIKSRSALELILFVEIKKAEGFFIKSQKEQLSEGQNYEGDTLGVYTEATENWERNYTPRQPKIAGEPYNFEDTGGFFDGIILNVSEDAAQFWSTDEKTEDLVVEYKGLFGLQEDRLKQIIKNVIAPAFLRQIRKHLDLL